MQRTSNALVGLLAAAAAMAVSLLPGQSALAMDASMASPSDASFILLVNDEQSLVDLTNADRVANGVDPVTWDADTVAIARARAEQQLGSQSLSHYDTSGQLVFSELLGQANLGYQLAGENLARASTSDATVTYRIEQALMQSPTHRKNILEQRFHRLAIGAATDPTTGQIAFAEVYRD